MKRILSLCLVLLILLMASGCGGKPASVQNNSNDSDNEDTAQPLEKEDGSIRIAVICKAMDSEFWTDVKRGAEDAAKELDILVEVMAPEKEADVDQQFKMIEDAISEEYDALAVAPCDSTSVMPILEKAAEAGIHVLTVDTDTANPDSRLAYIGTDNLLGGQMAAARMAELFKEKPDAKIAMITGVLGQKTQSDRAEGFKEGLTEAGLTLVDEQAAESDPVKAMDAMGAMLVNHPDLDGVFVSNALMALSAIEAIESTESNVKVIGFDSSSDALMAVKDGRMDALIAQAPYNMGKYAVEMAADAVEGKTISENADTGTELVTIENVDEYLNP